MSVLVEPAALADLGAVTEIYAHAVRSGPASFDLEPPSLAHWRAVHAGLDPGAGHHLLVARVDGGVIGWVKSGPYRPKAAYATSVETSVYVADGHAGRGVGSALYAELLRLLELADVHRAYAAIAQPNPASVALHERHGFRQVGIFSEVGRKLGNWWDIAWYERPIGVSAV